jgi:hypothetical protein
MEQPLSVALMVEPFLALPWLPHRAARFLGAASFIRLALRARRKPKRSKAFPRDNDSNDVFSNPGMTVAESICWFMILLAQSDEEAGGPASLMISSDQLNKSRSLLE